MANLAREKHLKAIQEDEIETRYVQFDEMQTFEKNKHNPLGIQLAIRPKTGQILSARVCEIPSNRIYFRSVPNKKIHDRKTKMANMLIEESHCLNEKYSVLSFDGAKLNSRLASEVCSDSLQETHVRNYAGMWRLNQICEKLRQRLSCLKRKTWATTKDRKYLQMYLDIFIACQNGYKL